MSIGDTLTLVVLCYFGGVLGVICARLGTLVTLLSKPPMELNIYANEGKAILGHESVREDDTSGNGTRKD